MAPHSSTLAWKIPWMEEPSRLQSMGSLRVGHDWATELNWTELKPYLCQPLTPQYFLSPVPSCLPPMWRIFAFPLFSSFPPSFPCFSFLYPSFLPSFFLSFLSLFLFNEIWLLELTCLTTANTGLFLLIHQMVDTGWYWVLILSNVETL